MSDIDDINDAYKSGKVPWPYGNPKKVGEHEAGTVKEEESPPGKEDERREK